MVVSRLIISFVMCCFFFFFKQKTAYEMRISDWSSDVCSSDLTLSVTSISSRCGGSPLCASADTTTEAKLGSVSWSAETLIATFRFDGHFIASWHEIGRASCRERVCQYV